MYTEENEFDYNDYLDEEEKYNSNKHVDFGFIFKIIVIIILIILIIFLVFKIKNRNTSTNNNKNKTNKNVNDNVALVDNNINLIRDASVAYFFKGENLPVEISEKKDVTVNELIKEKLLISIKDKNNNICGYNASGSTIIKNTDDYKLNVTLACIDINEEKDFYYSLDGSCLNCNGENYNPNKEENKEEKKNEIAVKEKESKEETNNEFNQNNELNSNTNTKTDTDTINKTCGTYSEWTTILKNDSNLERETRTLVKAYKNEVEYGAWSEETESKIEANSNLEVKTITKIETQTKRTCSDESTKKPTSQDNREITSRVSTKKTTKKVCTGGQTYTRTLTKWDNSADSCKSSGIGKVVCTYKTKKTCTNKTTTKKVTYYTYCDTETVEVPKTMYTSRTITYTPIYTDYILESEIPEGYQRVIGSELIQYRYREKCGK